MRTKLKKITYPKPRLNDEIENKLKFYKKMKNKKNKDWTGNPNKSEDK